MKTVKFLALAAAAIGFAVSASCCSKSAPSYNTSPPAYVAPAK